MEYMTVAFLSSARANTKVGSKQRKPIESLKGSHFVNGRKERKHKYKYRFPVYDQSGTVNWLGTNEKKDPRREITTRGMAKNSWAWLMVKIYSKGAKPRYGGKDGRRASRKFISMKKRLKAFNPSVEIENRISYMLKVFPDVVRIALRKANKGVAYKIKHGLNRYYKRKVFI